MQTVTDVKYFASGVWPFRVWTLQAFDANGVLIVEISKNYGMLGNAAKLQDFLKELRERNYECTRAQINEISEALDVD